MKKQNPKLSAETNNKIPAILSDNSVSSECAFRAETITKRSHEMLEILGKGDRKMAVRKMREISVLSEQFANEMAWLCAAHKIENVEKL